MGIDDFFERAITHFSIQHAHAGMDKKWRAMAKLVAQHEPEATSAPVVFFDASTRLSGMSLNAAFSLISSWSLRLQGVPVVRFVCERGMTQCVLGTSRDIPPKAPPCAACTAQSKSSFKHANKVDFTFTADPMLEDALKQVNIAGLMTFNWQGLPLGELVMPSTRWILRRHHLEDNATTRRVLSEYIRSAWSVAQHFKDLLENTKPQAVVVFNGIQYPEATARFLARQHGLPVISHEVGLRRMSAFFTTGDATAYPLEIPASFELSDAQNVVLDEYLEKRFKGNFKMAGVKFWPEMSALDPEFLARVKGYKEVVPVFTNVIFDTSQPHANVIYEDMFKWLDDILQSARRHREVCFVIRAHPDEARKGKASEESVAAWAERNQVANEANIIFIPPEQFISSYDLIRMAKMVLVYNSTIGMEAAIMGKPVLAAGKSRYSQADVVWLPPTLEAYRLRLEGMLNNYEIDVPERFARNGRRFLFYQLYRASLSFEDFLEEDGVWQGYVRLADFEWSQLRPEKNRAMQTIADGILRGGDFLYAEESL